MKAWLEDPCNNLRLTPIAVEELQVSNQSDGTIRAIGYLDEPDRQEIRVVKVELNQSEAARLEHELGRVQSFGLRFPRLRRVRWMAAEFTESLRMKLLFRWQQLVAWAAFRYNAKVGPRCIRCDRLLRSAMTLDDGQTENSWAWEAPSGAVVCDGGWSFGSVVYDATMSDEDDCNTSIRLVICDSCIPKAIRAGTVREVRSPAPNRAEQSSVMKRHFILYPAPDLDGQWIAHCLQRDIITQGNSPSHALVMMAEAIDLIAGQNLIAGRAPSSGSSPLKQ